MKQSLERLWLFVPLLCLVLAQPAHAAEPSILALTHATVIDGAGRPAQPDVTVFVTGESGFRRLAHHQRPHGRADPNSAARGAGPDKKQQQKTRCNHKSIACPTFRIRLGTFARMAVLFGRAVTEMPNADSADKGVAHRLSFAASMKVARVQPLRRAIRHASRLEESRDRRQI
jgi:hypothetical protein